MGVGYFYTGLNSSIKQLASAGPLPDIQDLQNAELYNCAVTPWFHRRGDLQIVENQNLTDDTALILGLRAKVEL